MAEIRAKDVTVEKLFRACCHIDGCTWLGASYFTFACASAERLAHITRHRLAAADPELPEVTR